MSQYNFVKKPFWSADGSLIYSKGIANARTYAGPQGWMQPASGPSNAPITAATWANGAATVTCAAPIGTFTGSITASVLTLTTPLTGFISLGTWITTTGGTGSITGTCQLLSLLTGTFGVAGSTYAVSSAQTITGATVSLTYGHMITASQTAQATFTGTVPTSTTLTLNSTAVGNFQLGQVLSGTGISGVVIITTLLSGVLGASGSTYQLSSSQTVSAATALTASQGNTGRILVAGLVGGTIADGWNGYVPATYVSPTQLIYPVAVTPGTYANATFTGAVSGATLTATAVTGTISGSGNAQLSGVNVPQNTFIIGQLTGSSTGATFAGYISGQVLTITTLNSGTVAIGQLVVGSGILPGTIITSGSGLVWTINNPHFLGSVGTPVTGWTGQVASGAGTYLLNTSFVNLTAQAMASVGSAYRSTEIVVALSNLLTNYLDAIIIATFSAGVTYSGTAAMVTGDTLTITLTANEAVVVTGAPYINVTIGANTRKAFYATGSGTNVLTFTYKIIASDTATNWAPTHAYTVGQRFLNAGQWYIVNTGYTSLGTFGATDTTNATTTTNGTLVATSTSGTTSDFISDILVSPESQVQSVTYTTPVTTTTTVN